MEWTFFFDENKLVITIAHFVKIFVKTDFLQNDIIFRFNNMQLINHLPSNPGTHLTLQNIFNSYDNNVWIHIFAFKNNSKYSYKYLTYN